MAKKGFKRNKYGAKRTKVDGISFHSMREAKRWSELRILENMGKIKDLRRQVPYKLVMEVKYLADFVYYDVENGKHVTEDSKGFRTADYKRKRKLMLEQHGIEILET